MRVRRRQSRRVWPGCRDATLHCTRAECDVSGPTVRRQRRAVSIITAVFIPTAAAVSAGASRSACGPASRGGAGAQEDTQVEEVRPLRRRIFHRRRIQQRR